VFNPDPLLQTVMRGEMALEPYITHTFDGLEGADKTYFEIP
jgi:hypothetical protein